MGSANLTSFGGLQIVVSPHVPEGEIYFVGRQNVVAPQTFAKLRGLQSDNEETLRKVATELAELEAVPGFGSF